MENITFDKLNLSKTTLEAITKKGFKVASEIQAKIIPIIFEQQKDIVGIAQTGTGKTGAFGLPLVDIIYAGNKFPQAIILAPTRELALQVTSELDMFCAGKKLNILTIYGGASINNQIKELRKGIDIVVGTPGRVVDLLKRKELVLKQAKYFVLDEADEMLKMGFIEDIEFILDSSCKQRKVYLFSATMPQRIKQLSKKYMKDQEIIEAKKKQEVSSLIEQIFYKAKQSEKFTALRRIIDAQSFFYGIVFCRTKSDVDNVTASLKKSGHEVDCIHGDIVQNKREKILAKFREMKINILVATDVAARGIDVANLTHVINYNLPEDSLTYTHRIGRTGRAGSKGVAISLVSPSEMRKLSMFEKELKIQIKSQSLPTEKEAKDKKAEKFFSEISKIISEDKINNNMEISKKLLEMHNPEKVISALIYKINNKRIDVDDFSNTNTKSDRNMKSDRREKNRDREPTSKGDTRVFIAKGKMDKFDKRGLINFIERETRVRLGQVKDVKVCDKFSFITMNSGIAHNVVEAFEAQGRRRPLAEIAEK
ncbi:MAG: DEAD/DEAH box helicase [Nanoarchaeota archaeon]